MIRDVLITGGTGYLGRALLPALLARGHRVRALVRPGSEKKLPPGVAAITGNPLVADDVARALPGTTTLVHLVGVPKPSPAKAQQFREIDLVSIQATVAALERLPAASRPHLVYLSVAQPTSVMREYIDVRAEGEALIRAHGLAATFVRPWYVLGPGHWWPVMLLPVYALMRCFPKSRASAERLGLVTLRQMTDTLVHVIERPAPGIRVVDVPQIRRSSNQSSVISNQ